MAGMYGTFGDVKKVIVVVVVLVVGAFGFGYCKGYQSGKGESSGSDFKQSNEWKPSKGSDWKQ